MDFLDPDKMRRQHYMLFVGYILIAIAIVATALILLYQSSGFGINRKGEVIQNGLVFTGSTPDGAEIFLNGEDSTFRTNKRLVLVAGKYVLQFKKDGYYPWSRNIDVQGGSVGRMDYAFLFPTKLDTSSLKNYTAMPGLATQSPDRRWILVQTGADLNSYEVYDLKNPAKTPVQLTLPAGVLSEGADQSLKLVEWSNDNSHVLIQHSFSGKTEFVLIDREAPQQSVNLNSTLGASPSEIRLIDKKYDRYYLYFADQKLLQSASLGNPKPVDYIKNVLAYKSYSDDTMLYVTDDVKADPSAVNQLAVKLAIGDQTYTIRKISAGTHYLLEIAKYSGDLYVMAGVDTENKVIVYKNPRDQINNPDIGVAVQVAILRLNAPNFVSFSNNTQYLMAENGNNFSVYDAEYDKTYTYSFPKQPLDAPQEHASWMDGNRLLYVSNGKVFVFDYDQTNRRSLNAATPAFIPAFAPDYRRLFTLTAPDASGASKMTQTWLRTTADR